MSKRKYTYKEIAEWLGVSKSMISKVATVKRRFGRPSAIVIAHKSGLSEEFIYRHNGPELIYALRKAMERGSQNNTITFPWPPRELSPNVRVHWSVKARATRAYRRECMVITRNSGIVALNSYRISLFVTFYPPDRRRRDDDNVFASAKAMRDGIADALCINDNRFIYRPFLHTDTRPGGEVVVKITGNP